MITADANTRLEVVEEGSTAFLDLTLPGENPAKRNFARVPIDLATAVRIRHAIRINTLGGFQ